MQRLRYSQHLKSIFILLDAFTLLGVFVYFQGSLFYSQQIPMDRAEKNGIIFLILTAYWLLISGRTLLYSIPRNLTYTKYLERFIHHFLLFTLGVWLLSLVLSTSFLKESRYEFLLVLCLSILLTKSLAFFLLKHLRTKGKNFRNIMFWGDGTSMAILKKTLEKRRDYGFKLFDYKEDKNIHSITEFWKAHSIHTLFYHLDPSTDFNFERELFQQAELHEVQIKLVPDISENHFFGYDWEYVESLPILTPAKSPLEHLSNVIIKRLFDLVFSLFFLLFISSWLFPIIIIFIKLGSKGPAFFIQKRYGYHNQIFNCYKFRTMYNNRESSTKTTCVNDCRITPIGKFLRKTSLDETPQFLNVLMGNMSIIGPRPHMIVVDDHYKLKIKQYNIRSLVKPGITGLAQVSGLRGDDGDMDIEMKKRILADTFYVKNWSFSLDLVILFKTCFLLILGDKNAR